MPTLQRLVDRASGSDAVTVLINTFTSGEAVPEHTHEVEEVLLVTAGECTVTVDGRPEAARTGDAVSFPATRILPCPDPCGYRDRRTGSCPGTTSG